MRLQNWQWMMRKKGKKEGLARKIIIVNNGMEMKVCSTEKVCGNGRYILYLYEC
jgi:hypothetical protein